MKGKNLFGILIVLVCLMAATMCLAAEPIKIVRVVGLTGALEAYAKQSLDGFKMGLEYATKGTNEIIGRPVELIVKDTQLKPDMGKQLLTEAFKDDGCDLAVGGGQFRRGPGHAARGRRVQKGFEWWNRPWPTALPAKPGTAIFSAPAVIRPRTPLPMPWPWPNPGSVIAHPGPGLCLWPRRRGRL